LPSSLPREDVPWVEVGEGWYVVLYEASQVDLVAGTPFVSGPVVLYLVNQSGIRYEVVRWEPESGPLGLVDAWATTALVAGVGTADEETLYEAVDLVTGEVMPVYSVALPNRNHTISRELSLSRTNAENLVIYRLDGVSEFLERRSFDGAVLATLYDGDYVSQLEALQWLDHHDGTSLLVSSSNGIAHVSNDGAELGEVLIPADFRCDPVRWWDAETFLSACYLRSFGEPESGLDSPVNYGQLWLLEENGAEGVALTGLPVEAPDFFDHGFRDAWPNGENILLQWHGECGGANIATLHPDGSTEFVNVSLPPPLGESNVEIVDVVNSRIVVKGFQGCDGWGSGLFALDLNGTYLHDLVPMVGDAGGVLGVKGFASLYP
jgi:TolB protein